MKKEILDWKVHDALRDLNRKQNYMHIAAEYVKDKCRQAVAIGGFALGVSGVIVAPLGLLALVAEQFAGSKAEAYETSRPRSDVYEQKYSDLVEKVSEKTGVDERILLGLIAGGNSTYANDLRENGYAGIVPVRPEEAGVTAETLSNDDEQCLLSAARVFQEIAGSQNSHNLEAAVGCFWYRKMQEDAEKNSAGNWDYVSSAVRAYEMRQDSVRVGNLQEQLQAHEGALAIKENLKQRFSGKELDFWMIRSTGLQREIKDPAFLFFCTAAIEAHRRYRAGDEFEWIDLLPVKPSAAIGCSLAYMDGVELTNGK
ncbi:hypothetical protein KY338_02070 [Candidatus Woesearchaeota archaeon]|nr:hypothetical protein [Candidatus Woesearchaeota archaeon]MBW3005936.1 hypothetical protein [Candidatus Woesearchaeota archaeon]